MGSWLAILNPKAGWRQPPARLQTMADRLRRELGAEVRLTERPGHAVQLAAEARDFQGLAVLGGDGTVSEVVNGMSLASQRLLVLTGGTGNGLARDLGLSGFDAALAAAKAGRVRPVDLVRVTFRAGQEQTVRLEVSTAAVGYAAEVTALSKHCKWLGGLCYPLAATVQAVRQRSLRLGTQVGEDPVVLQRLSNVMVNNTRHAGCFSAFRGSRPGDGALTVLLARAWFLPQMLHNVAVLTKTYFYATGRELTTRSIDIRLPTPSRLMIDGELWEGVTEARFDVLPGALRCLA